MTWINENRETIKITRNKGNGTLPDNRKKYFHIIFTHHITYKREANYRQMFHTDTKISNEMKLGNEIQQFIKWSIYITKFLPPVEKWDGFNICKSGNVIATLKK